eukprot:gene11098-5438_t
MPHMAAGVLPRVEDFDRGTTLIERFQRGEAPGADGKWPAATYVTAKAHRQGDINGDYQIGVPEKVFQIKMPMLVLAPSAQPIPANYEHLCNLVHRGPRDDGHCVTERPVPGQKAWELVDSLRPEERRKVKLRRARRQEDRVWRVLRKPMRLLLAQTGDSIRMTATALGMGDAEAHALTEEAIRTWMQPVLSPYYQGAPTPSTAERRSQKRPAEGDAVHEPGTTTQKSHRAVPRPRRSHSQPPGGASRAGLLAAAEVAAKPT